jgi:hypothetical protein
MANVACNSKWVKVVHLRASEHGYGTRRNARINAFRKAFDAIGATYFAQIARNGCRRGCTKSVWPPNSQLVRPAYTTFSPPIARGDGSFRVTCTLNWPGWVKCTPSERMTALVHAGGYESVVIGPFGDKDDAVASQAAAVAPEGGGKTGVFVAGSVAENGEPGPDEFAYIMYLPGGRAVVGAAADDDTPLLEAFAFGDVGDELEAFLTDDDLEPPPE